LNIIILLLGALAAFGPLSIDMYLPALPGISGDLKAPLSTVQLSLASYFIGLAVGQIFYGPLTDRVGRKIPLYIGISIYLISSFCCSQVTSVEWLIFFRFTQALGSCAGVVISRAIVRDKYTPQESARIFSILMLIMGVAPIIAPLIGGEMSAQYGWRSIFWLLTSFSALSLVGIFFFLPETHKFDSKTKLSETFGIYGTILRSKEFMGHALAGGFAQAGMFAYITGSPFVFMSIYELTPKQYGWIFGTNAFGLIFCSQLNRYFLKNHTPLAILKVVYPLLAVVSVFIMIVGGAQAGLVLTVAGIFIFLSLLGMTFPNSTASALANQGRYAGSASALLGTLQYGTSAIFSSVVSALHNGTQMPMSVVIGICGISAFGIFYLLAEPATRNEVKTQHRVQSSQDETLIVPE
jgi:DHA1 family bicyclomycin/chloramphenicol resistance-like MFS transporter